MKKNLFKLVISLIFVVMTVVCLSVFMLTDASAATTITKASGFAGGNGDSDNPYQIATAAQLEYFAEAVAGGNKFEGKYVVLTADIEVNSCTADDVHDWYMGNSNPTYCITAIGSWDNPFCGIFDGQGHTLSGVYVEYTDTDRAGLFGCTGYNYNGAGKTATVRNFAITKSYFYGKGNVSAVVSQTRGATTIENIFLSESVYVESTAASAGSILGCIGGSSAEHRYNGTTVQNCASGATVYATGKNYIGGIVGNGNSQGLDVTDCLFYGKVEGSRWVSGIVGYDTGYNTETAYADHVTVTRCVNVGEIKGTYTSANNGKKCGIICFGARSDSYLTVVDCFCTGDTTYRAYRNGNYTTGSTEITADAVTTKGFVNGTGSALRASSDNDQYWVELQRGVQGSRSILYVPAPLVDALKTNKVFLNSASTTPSWLSSYTGGSGTVTIDTPAKWIEFCDFFNGYYSTNCANGGSGLTVNITADLTFNTDAASGLDNTSWSSVDYDLSGCELGKDFNPFKGTINGNGHTISGIYMYTTDYDSGLGLVGYAQSATIKNLVITNSYFRTDWRKIAAVVGAVAGKCDIRNIYVTDSVYINAYRGNRAGIVSTVIDDGVGGHTVDSCVNAATISYFYGSNSSTNTSFAGGILGNGNSTRIDITNCLNIANITGYRQIGGIAGAVNHASSVTSNCVNFGSTPNNSYCGNITNAGSGGLTLTFTNCFGISSRKGRNISDESTYTQITVADTIAAGFLSGSGSALASTWTEMNFGEVCLPTTIANTIAPLTPVATYADTSSFTVSSVAVFKQLARFVNTGRGDFSGKTVTLGASITFNSGTASASGGLTVTNDMTNYMVGTTTFPFAGTFDGNDKTISGFYASSDTKYGTGIFGDVSGTVQDLIVTNSYIYTSKYTVGGVAGQAAMGSTFSNIYVTKSVYVTAHGDNPNGNAGGIIGSVDDDNGSGTITISGCLNAATVRSVGNSTASYRMHVGGIIGITQNELITISGCMNAGFIQGSWYVGGIVGEADTKATIQNCLNVGTVIGDAKTGNIYLYADIWCGSVSKAAYSVSLSNCYGINSRLAEHQDTASLGTISLSNVKQISVLDVYGSDPAKSLPKISITGFTSRAGAIMVPSGVSGYVNSADKFFDIKMENGASVRTNTPFGIRFVAELNISAFTNITEYGILFGPTDKVSASGFNPASLSKTGDNKDYVQVKSQVTVSGGNGTNGYYQFALAVNVAESNFYRDFSARAYVIANGVTYYSDYIELNNSRSVSNVARLACEDVLSLSSGNYTYPVGTVYSCYSDDQRTELKKYFKNEIRVLQIEMGQNNETYDAGRTDVAVKEIYKYDPDVIILSGSSDLTFTGLTGYTTSGLSGNANGSRRVLFKASRFTKGSEGDISTWGRYVYLTDTVTGKSSFFASVDANLVANKTYSDVIKNDGTIGNGVSKGLIIAGYFAGDGDNSNAKNGYLSSIHENATTQYYTNYLTRHNKAKTGSFAIMTGSLYKSGYADAVRYRISEEQFGMCSAYNPSVCDYILK